MALVGALLLIHQMPLCGEVKPAHSLPGRLRLPVHVTSHPVCRDGPLQDPHE